VILIYRIVDCDTGRIGYVGKTSQGLHHRLRDHLRDNAKTHKVRWLKTLKTKPSIEPVAFCCEDNWVECERHWIAFYRKLGGLTNSTDGGDGPNTYDEARRKKISDALKGVKRPCSPLRAAAISAAKKGRGNGLIGRPCSESTRMKISRANLGRISPQKGLKQSPDHIAARVRSRLLNEKLKKEKSL